MHLQKYPSMFLLLVLIALPHAFQGLHVRNSSDPLPPTNSTRPPAIVTENVIAEEEDQLLALPDDSLADADLHDHDVIDSVVYLYFGGDAALPPRSGGGSSTWMNDGWWLWWAAGPVLSIPPQALTLWSALRRLQRRRRPRRRRRQVEDPRCHYAPPLLVGILATCLAASGSLLLAGGTWIRLGTLPCLVLAMVTHYIHLVCAVGLAALPILTLCSLPTSTSVATNNSQAGSLCAAIAIIWVLPAPILYACYNWNSRGYEWRHYCWLSVEGGMVLSFLAPVATLMLVGTIASLMALRRLSANTAAAMVSCGTRGYQNLAAARRWVRAGATLLPMFAVSWFCSVIAIENLDSLLLVTMSSASFILFNWTLFISSYMALPNSNGEWSLPFNNHQITVHAKTSCQCKFLSRNDCTNVRNGDPDAKPLLSDETDDKTWENVLNFISETGGTNCGSIITLVENEETQATAEDSLELQVDSISLISS